MEDNRSVSLLFESSTFFQQNKEKAVYSMKVFNRMLNQLYFKYMQVFNHMLNIASVDEDSIWNTVVNSFSSIFFYYALF